MTRSTVARLGVATLVALYAGLGSLLASALAYPGGSWADATAEGFDPRLNFWCDLMRGTAVDGRPNGTSKLLASLAFASLAVALATYWKVATRSSRRPRLARLARTAGWLAAVSTLLLALLPYDTRETSHVLASLAAGGFGLAAALVCIAESLAANDLTSWRNVWGLALAGFGLANLAIYVDLVLLGGTDGPALPVVQKLGTLCLAAWMTATVLDERARAAGEDVRAG